MNDDVMEVTGLESAQLYSNFFKTDVNELETQGEPDMERVLGWWQAAAGRVPGYHQFLQQQGLDPTSINAANWSNVPVVDKKNYISHYALAELCWDGTLDRQHLIAVSSGSTGQPYFWARGLAQELRTAYRFESIYRNAFQMHQRNTLVVICFTMGTWVGGMFTAGVSTMLAQKGYKLTVVAPGNNMTEIMRVIKTLAPQFEQVVLAGYPPFIKDVLEAGTNEGVDWSKHAVKMIFAGEVFNEAWRDSVLARSGSTGIYTDTASLYGTADAGVLGNETPLSVAIRRFFSQNPSLGREFFGESRMPTLVQYDPTYRYFELVNGEIIFSSPTGIPLMRYNIHDSGGVVPYAEMMAFLAKQGFDPLATLREAGYTGQVAPQPFVYVFGRSDFTISYYGANVYIENVKAGLEDAAVHDLVTGKFVMSVTHDADQNAALLLRVELRQAVAPSEALRDQLAHTILTHLRHINAEYANYVPAKAALPLVELYPLGEPRFFPVGIKHRYTESRG